MAFSNDVPPAPMTADIILESESVAFSLARSIL